MDKPTNNALILMATEENATKEPTAEWTALMTPAKEDTATNIKMVI